MMIKSYKSVDDINQVLHWAPITQLQLKLLTLWLDSVLTSASSSQAFLQRIWALVFGEHLKITGFFFLPPSFFRSIISFKWEPGLWQTSYGGCLIQPESQLRSGWIVSEGSFMQSRLHIVDDACLNYQLVCFFFFGLLSISIIIWNCPSLRVRRGFALCML